MALSFHLTFILWIFIYLITITMCNSVEKTSGTAYSWIARLRGMQEAKKLYDLELPNLAKGLDVPEKGKEKLNSSSYGVIGLPELNRLNKLRDSTEDMEERDVFNSIDDFVREFERKWHVSLKGGVKKSRDLRNLNSRLHLHGHGTNHDLDNVDMKKSSSFQGDTAMLSSDEDAPRLRASRGASYNPNKIKELPILENDILEIGNRNLKGSRISRSYSDSGNFHKISPLHASPHSHAHPYKVKRENFNLRMRPHSARSDYGPINSDFIKGLLPSGLDMPGIGKQKLLNSEDITPIRSSRNSGNPTKLTSFHMVDQLKHGEDFHLSNKLELARGPRSICSPVESNRENVPSFAGIEPSDTGKQQTLTTIDEDIPKRLARSSEILKKMKDLIKSFNNLDFEGDLESSRAARSGYGPVGMANVFSPAKHLRDVNNHQKLSFANQDLTRKSRRSDVPKNGKESALFDVDPIKAILSLADQDSPRESRSSDVPKTLKGSALFDADPVKAIHNIIRYLNDVYIDSPHVANDSGSIGTENTKVSSETEMINKEKRFDKINESQASRSSALNNE